MDNPRDPKFGAKISKDLDIYAESIRSIAPPSLVEATINLSKGLLNPKICIGEYRELMLAFAHELSEAANRQE